MAKRHRERAKLRRTELIDILGGKCSKCGTRSRLEINHKYTRDWEPKEVSSDHRVCIYLREAKQGLLNVLCRKCNAKYKPKERGPF